MLKKNFFWAQHNLGDTKTFGGHFLECRQGFPHEKYFTPQVKQARN